MRLPGDQSIPYTWRTMSRDIVGSRESAGDVDTVASATAVNSVNIQPRIRVKGRMKKSCSRRGSLGGNERGCDCVATTRTFRVRLKASLSGVVGTGSTADLPSPGRLRRLRRRRRRRRRRDDVGEEGRRKGLRD